MRVFISSTVYDLIDVRAELAEQLRTLGIKPVLSDDKLSGFSIQQHDINSIETCLVNVDSCDEVVLILDKRYGPTLEKVGYGEISATHLEYRRAIEKKIPVRVYVRDRLEADFAIWKKNGDSVKKFSWIAEKEKGLFALLEEHKTLQENATFSNWYDTFTSSVDLKAAITKHFEKRMLPERLVQVIQDNEFPLMDIKVEISQFGNDSSSHFNVKANLTNVSRVPAFNFNVYWEESGNESEKNTIFPSGKTILNSYIWAIEPYPYKPVSNIEKFLIAEYESPIGILVRDRFRVNGRISAGIIISGGKLIDRKFRRSPPISIEIEDDI